MDTVLNASGAQGSNNNKDIDELYSVILKAALGDPNLDRADRDDMELVLHTVFSVQEALAVAALPELLHLYDTKRVYAAIRPLWSTPIAGETELVTTPHASFPGYMFTGQLE